MRKVETMTSNTVTRFKDIPMATVFQFAPSHDGFFNDRRKYCKISARKYSTLGALVTHYTIGSVNAPVIVEDQNYV